MPDILKFPRPSPPSLRRQLCHALIAYHTAPTVVRRLLCLGRVRVLSEAVRATRERGKRC